MKKIIFIICLSIPLYTLAQEDTEEITIEEQRTNAIKELLETVEINKGLYIKEDQERINKFEFNK